MYGESFTGRKKKGVFNENLSTFICIKILTIYNFIYVCIQKKIKNFTKKLVVVLINNYKLHFTYAQ